MTSKPHPFASPACSMPEIETGPHELCWKRLDEPASPDDGLRVCIDPHRPHGIHKDALPAETLRKDPAPSAQLRIPD